MVNASKNMMNTVEKFCSDLPTHLQALQELISEQILQADDFSTFRICLAGELHRLSGASMCLGFRKMGRLLEGLLVYVQEHSDQKGEAYSGFLNAVHDEIEELRRVSYALNARDSRLVARMRALDEIPSDIGGVEEPVHTGSAIMSKERILLADDDPYLGELISETLKKIGVETLTIVTSGAEALAQMKNVSPTLVITDWQMMPVTGLELLRSIRAGDAGVSGDLPVLFYTARRSEAEMHRASREGVTVFLPKPVMPDRLAHAVRTLVEKRYHSRARRPAA